MGILEYMDGTETRFMRLCRRMNAFKQSVLRPHICFDYALDDMYKGWTSYAAMHRRMYGRRLLSDYVLGREWARIGLGLMVLIEPYVVRRRKWRKLHDWIAYDLQCEGFDPDTLTSLEQVD